MENKNILSKSVDALTVESGTASMRHMLDNLRPTDSSKAAQWDKKTKSFCQLFEAYLRSRNAAKIDWYRFFVLSLFLGASTHPPGKKFLLHHLIVLLLTAPYRCLKVRR